MSDQATGMPSKTISRRIIIQGRELERHAVCCEPESLLADRNAMHTDGDRTDGALASKEMAERIGIQRKLQSHTPVPQQAADNIAESLRAGRRPIPTILDDREPVSFLSRQGHVDKLV